MAEWFTDSFGGKDNNSTASVSELQGQGGNTREGLNNERE